MVEVPGDTHTITCTRLTLRDGTHLFLRVKWFATTFQVTALDFPNSWSYYVAKQEIERRASMFGVTGEEYLSHTRLYLGEYGVQESEYSFEPMIVPRPRSMRLSWTTSWTTNDDTRMALFLSADSNPMELVPGFLHALMNTTLMVQEEARRKKHSQHKKARRLAMQFSAPEKARRRSLSRGSGELYVKSEFPESTPMFSRSYGLSAPTPPPILASSSKPLNLGLYSADRETPFSYALGSYQAPHRSQLMSEYQARREQAIQVPMTADHDFFLDRAGSSQMKIPVKVDVSNGRFFESQPMRFHDVGAMAYEPRKVGAESGWINPRKSSTGLERTIVLSDSDEETYVDMGAGVESLLAANRYCMANDDGSLHDLGRQTRSRKRKERDDAPDRRVTDNQNKVCVLAAAPARVKIEGEQHTGIFNYETRAQSKAVHLAADSPSGTLSNTPNHESRADRAQWSTWISEAKTVFLDSSEAPTHNGDSANGGQPTENMVNTRDLEGFQTSTLHRNLDVVDFPHTDAEYLQSPTETPTLNIPGREGNSVRKRQENGAESDSVEEHVYDDKDDNEVTGVGESAAKMRGTAMSLQKGAGIQKLPGRRGRPPGTKSKKKAGLEPTKSKPTRSATQGSPIQSDVEPKVTSSQRSLPAARPVGRPKQAHRQPPAADYVVKKTMVDVDQDLQKAVPDSDHYCFDNDRGKEKIKPDEVWALYDDIDSMPRTLIRVKEVSTNGPFWVKAIWLRPQKYSKKKAGGFPISIGEFDEPKESTVIRALNCFSHKMEFTQKTTTMIQVYPRKGEIWALCYKEEGAKQKGKKGNESDEGKRQFHLVVIVSNCGEPREIEILVLRKRTGYRTLWEPGYKKGSLGVEYLERFSHRVPAYKLTEKDYPDLDNLDIWDIDAAAVPPCQSKVT